MSIEPDSPMKFRPYRATMFMLYQLSLALGIVLLPVALVTNRLGIHLPVGRLVSKLGNAYESP